MTKGVVKRTMNWVKRSLLVGRGRAGVPDGSLMKIGGMVGGLTFSFDLMRNSDHCTLRNVWMFILMPQKHTVIQNFDSAQPFKSLGLGYLKCF